MAVDEVTNWGTAVGTNASPHPSGPAGREAHRIGLTFRDIMGAIARWRDELAAAGGPVADGTTLNATLRWNGSAWVEETSATIDTDGDVAGRTFSADNNIIGGFGFQDTGIPSLRGDSSNNHLEFVATTTQVGYMTSAGDLFMDGSGYFETDLAVGPQNREFSVNSSGYIIRYADVNTHDDDVILKWSDSDTRFNAVDQYQTSTTTALEDDTNAINTSTAKKAGYMVFNTTTNTPVWAAGSGDTDVWVDATGTTAHTPV